MEKLIVLIVAKTRRGAAACIGGIAADGRSVRLEAANKGTDEHAGMQYAVGEVWEVEAKPAAVVTPPHVETVVVYSQRRRKQHADVVAAVERHMPPHTGGVDQLYDGLVQATASGALYVADRTGIPAYSTCFWRPDRPLVRDVDGKRVRYRYPTDDGGHTLTYVGFDAPIDEIPAGTLLRVSLAHWWRPPEKPEEELRCYLQLSGWFLPQVTEVEVALPEQSTAEATTLPVDLSTARSTLKDVFGFATFRPLQEEIVASVLAGRDTLAILPTGGGKSLCYQLPALLRDGLTVVVSPLIALMQDQVDALRQLDVPAIFLNSTVAYADYVAATRRLRAGQIKLLYVAPETLLRTETLLLLDQCRVTCLTIDEAHCISQWGHDFRQEYRQLLAVRRRYPAAVCVALTATAAPRVQRDIRTMLAMHSAATFVASFDRANLFLKAAPRIDGLGQVRAMLAAHPDQSGIIYCSTRKQVDLLVRQLTALGQRVLPYHAGLDDGTRAANQRAFVRDEVPIMVATVAFGMGIDKSNVRFVVHFNLPSSLEQYYQEVGRAGRDDLPATCLLLYSQHDMMTQAAHIDEGAEQEKPGRHARLQAMLRFAQGQECRRKLLLAYFGETYAQDSCGRCDLCTGGATTAPKIDVTDAARRLLACVQQTGERFGISHVVQVLRGSQAARIANFRHNQLPCHGSGRDLPEVTWKALAHQLITQGILAQDMEHATLSLTARGHAVLAGKEPVLAALEVTHTSQTAASGDVPTHDAELFVALRVLRRDLAQAENVPPYLIFSDRTLVEMASWMPRTEAALLAVSGVGRAKFARYGLRFLALIGDYCTQHNLNMPERQPLLAAPPPDLPKRRWMEVGELFAAGASIEALVAMYGVKQRTIINHLYDYVQAGHPADGERIQVASRLPQAQQDAVLAAMRSRDNLNLTPIFEHFGGAIAYEELALLRLVLLAAATASAPAHEPAPV